MGVRIAKIVFSVLFGWMVFCYFQFSPLVSYSFFEVVMNTQQEGTLYFQYRYDEFEPKFSETRTRHLPHGEGSTLKIGSKLRDARISDARILLDDSGQIELERLTLYSNYQKNIRLGPTELSELVDTHNVKIELVNNNLIRFIPTGITPYIEFNISGTFKEQTNLSIWAPIFAAGTFLLLIWNWHWRDSIIYKDLALTYADERHINALDGLRGLAAVAVVGDHAWGWLSGSGTFGVWIFFALSGFLLLQPLIREPDRGLSSAYILGYLRRRALRIIPLYYTLLLGLYLSIKEADLLFQHMLFIRGDGHLWTLPEEIFFYLCLPIVAFMLALCAKVSRLFALFALIVLWLVLIYNPKIIPVKAYLFGGQYHMHLGWFLGGGVAAYLSYLQGKREIPIRWQHIIGIAAALVFIAALLYSSIPIYEILYGKPFPAAKFKPLPFAFISAFLVWAFAVTPNGIISKFLSLPLLRWMGLVGFGIYLFHPSILFALDVIIIKATGHMPDGKIRFLLTTIVALWFSSITYKLIERPFLNIAKNKA